MRPTRLHLTSIAVLLATISIGEALALDCASAPMRGSDGTYNGCEIVQGGDVLFRDSEEVTEKMCPQVCAGVSIIEELAKESLELDIEAGIGTFDPDTI